MKNLFKIGLVGVCALVGLAANVNAAPVSFNITNYIVSGQSITSYPTNVYSTNGQPQATGNGVACYQQEHIGFNFQGWLVSTSSANIGFTFVTSMAGNQPAITVSSNALSATYTVNDWNTVGPNLSVVIALSAGTNWVNYQTNFPLSSLGLYSEPTEANYIGVYTMTNSLASGQFITNCAAYINKKIIPRSLIGGGQ